MKSWDPTRATLTALSNAVGDIAPDSAELARARLILRTDEFWAPVQANPSGEHAISVRVHPSRLGRLGSPGAQAATWATLVTVALQLAQWYLTAPQAPAPGAPSHQH